MSHIKSNTLSESKLELFCCINKSFQNNYQLLSAGMYLESWVVMSVALPTELNELNISGLMTVLVYTCAFYTLVWINSGMFRLAKIYSMILKSKLH